MVLVTGATGILGRVLVLKLIEKGKKVRATKRKNSNLQEVRKSFRFYTQNPDEIFEKIEWIDFNLNDSTSLQDALKGIDEVYHCAAKVSFNPADKKELFRTNISGTKQLLYACENSSVKKFCHISSIATLDGTNEQGLTDEDCNFNSKLDHSDYALSKQYSEMEVWRASAEGLNTLILNPGMIVGSGNWNQSSGEIYKSFLNKFTFSGGTAYVDVRDIAEIAIKLMSENVFGERFILISENKRYQDLAKMVRNSVGKSAPIVVPKTLLNFGKYLNYLFGWFVPPLRMINSNNIEAICSESTITNQKIKEKLNFEFIPVEESLKFHFKNYRTEHQK